MEDEEIHLTEENNHKTIFIPVTCNKILLLLLPDPINLQSSTFFA